MGQHALLVLAFNLDLKFKVKTELRSVSDSFSRPKCGIWAKFNSNGRVLVVYWLALDGESPTVSKWCCDLDINLGNRTKFKGHLILITTAAFRLTPPIGGFLVGF